jgi:hypothetical protein
MTKVYGVLVGANLQLSPPRLAPGALQGEFEKRLMFDRVALNANAAADIISLGKFSIDAILDPSATLYYDALGANTQLQVGNADYPAALAAAAATSAAGSRSIISSVGLALYGAPLWQQLGYADRPTALLSANVGPSGMTELICTLSAAAGNPAFTGNVAWRVQGCDA